MLEGIINGEGRLYIKRGSILKPQSCYYREGLENACGDSCPLFGEPHRIYDNIKATLEICNGRVLNFMKLEDQR